MSENMCELDKWLRKNFMSKTQFAKMVGCSRTVIWKVQKKLRIMPKFAKIIRDITCSEVLPDEFPRGRNWRSKNDIS